MAAMKQPQDHKPKKGRQTATIDGITVHVDLDVLHDADLMDDLYDLQRGELLPTPILRKVFGSEYKTVKEKLRDPDTGLVPVERLVDFFAKVLSELAPNS